MAAHVARNGAATSETFSTQITASMPGTRMSPSSRSPLPTQNLVAGIESTLRKQLLHPVRRSRMLKDGAIAGSIHSRWGRTGSWVLAAVIIVVVIGGISGRLPVSV